MTARRHALLLFTKLPKPGLTKTRLTEARGGILTAEEAAEFYRCSLLDVAEIALSALDELNQAAKSKDSGDRYELAVSCSPASDQPGLAAIFAELGEAASAIHYIADAGANFDEHFDNAFQQLFQQGFHSVVSVGGDLPLLPPSHLVRAFNWLEYFESSSDKGAFVQAPCQECGVSLVGYTAKTPMNSTGVFYNLDGVAALDAYTQKAAENSVPMASLEPVADIDDTADLAHAATLIRATAYSANFQPGVFVPRRTLNWLDTNGIVIATPPNQEHDPREMIDVAN